MNIGLLKSVVWRNAIGALALLIAFYIPDRFSLEVRTGYNKFLPYVFLLMMYGWIVFHNRVLFEGLFLQNRKQAYLLWTTAALAGSSIIMHLVIVHQFGQQETLSKLLTFWVFTITGLGIYVIFKFLDVVRDRSKNSVVRPMDTILFFNCIVDGVEKQLPLSDIFYIESLENYVKVITKSKTYLVRLSLKEAEQSLPKSFLRISRSHIINTHFIESAEADSLRLHGVVFKIGKVYKRYVEEQLNATY